MNQENSHNRGSQVDPETLLPINPDRLNNIKKQRRARQRQRNKRIGALKQQGKLSPDYLEQ